MCRGACTVAAAAPAAAAGSARRRRSAQAAWPGPPCLDRQVCTPCPTHSQLCAPCPAHAAGSTVHGSAAGDEGREDESGGGRHALAPPTGNTRLEPPHAIVRDRRESVNLAPGQEAAGVGVGQATRSEKSDSDWSFCCAQLRWRRGQGGAASSFGGGAGGGGHIPTEVLRTSEEG